MSAAFVACGSITTHAISQTVGSTQTERRAQSGNLVGHGGPVKAIAVSSDGTRALTGSFDYSAIHWDISGDAPKQVRRFTDHAGAVNAVAFVKGQRALTAGDEGRVSLWDLDSGALIHRFEGHDAGSKVVGLDVSRDGQWAVSAGWDRTARLWNLETLQAGPVLREHTGPVNAAVFSGFGETTDWFTKGPAEAETPAEIVAPLVYTASSDGDIRAFDFATGALQRRVYSSGQSINALLRLRAGDAQVNTGKSIRAAFARDELLFGTVSGQSGIIDGRSGELIQQLPETDRPILALAEVTFAISNHGGRRPGHIAVGSGDGKVRVFSDVGGGLLQEYRSAFGPVWALALRHTGFVASATALYHAGLDDFVTYWPFAPRAPFEPVDASQYPRRFQSTGKPGDDTGARGELQFARKCSICHTLTPDGGNRAGPSLHGIFGRRIATLPGYLYSEPLKTLDIVWTPETLSKLFEIGPDKFTPGSKMPLQVMSAQGDRDDLIAFLTIATGDPKPVDGAPVPPQKSDKP